MRTWNPRAAPMRFVTVVATLAVVALAACRDKSTEPQGPVVDVHLSRPPASNGVETDRVRIVIVRPPSETIKDTTFALPAGNLTARIPVVATEGEMVQASITYLAGTVTVSSGTTTLFVRVP
jgi:hypothetical protein